MRRTGHGTIYTEVSIDVVDVLSELTDDDIRDECEERNIAHSSASASESLAEAVERRHDTEHHGLQIMCRDAICEAATRDALPVAVRPAVKAVAA